MIIGGSGDDVIKTSKVSGSAILGDVGTIMFTSTDSPSTGICFTSISSMTSFANYYGGNDTIISTDSIDASINTNSYITLAIMGGAGDDRITVNTTSRDAFVCGDHCQGMTELTSL
jgi:hypothetical protein